MGVFRFKHFSVDDTGCGMKTGTDGVLLGAWAPLPATGEVLDAGCGSGLIGLMVAQRNPSLRVTGIEIEKEAADRAKANAAASPFDSRVKIVFEDLRIFAHQEAVKFNLVVSNPPYFRNSLKSPDIKTTLARHHITLDHTDLLAAARKLLTPEGSLCVILPASEHLPFLQHAVAFQLYPAETVFVHHRPFSKAVRVMLRLATDPLAPVCTQELYIRNDSNTWSEEYLDLVRDFYLFA